MRQVHSIMAHLGHNRRILLGLMVGTAGLALAAKVVLVAASGAALERSNPLLASRLWEGSSDAAESAAALFATAKNAKEARERGRTALRLSPFRPGALRAVAWSAQASGEPVAADTALALAARLGWRDGPTQRWILVKAYLAGDDVTAARAGDAMYRITYEPQIARALFQKLIVSESGRTALAERIAAGALWSKSFMREQCSRNNASWRALPDLLAKVDRLTPPPGTKDFDCFVDHLSSNDELAQLWRLHRLRHPDATGNPTLQIIDGDFASLSRDTAARGPFGWRSIKSRNIDMDLTLGDDTPSRNQITVEILGRKGALALTQLLALRPGRYSIRFEERFDEPEPVTPFLWTLICNRTGTLLTSTDNEAAATEWKERNLEFTVPVEGCFSQTLSLSTNRRPKQGATAHYRSMRLAATPSPHEATQ